MSHDEVAVALDCREALELACKPLVTSVVCAPTDIHILAVLAIQLTSADTHPDEIRLVARDTTVFTKDAWSTVLFGFLQTCASYNIKVVFTWQIRSGLGVCMSQIGGTLVGPILLRRPPDPTIVSSDLVYLDMSSQDLCDDAVLTALQPADIPSVRHLNLRNNLMTGTGAVGILDRFGPVLYTLQLDDNQLSGHVVAHLLRASLSFADLWLSVRCVFGPTVPATAYTDADIKAALDMWQTQSTRVPCLVNGLACRMCSGCLNVCDQCMHHGDGFNRQCNRCKIWLCSGCYSSHNVTCAAQLRHSFTTHDLLSWSRTAKKITLTSGAVSFDLEVVACGMYGLVAFTTDQTTHRRMAVKIELQISGNIFRSELAVLQRLSPGSRRLANRLTLSTPWSWPNMLDWIAVSTGLLQLDHYTMPVRFALMPCMVCTIEHACASRLPHACRDLLGAIHENIPYHSMVGIQSTLTTLRMVDPLCISAFQKILEDLQPSCVDIYAYGERIMQTVALRLHTLHTLLTQALVLLDHGVIDFDIFRLENTMTDERAVITKLDYGLTAGPGVMPAPEWVHYRPKSIRQSDGTFRQEPPDNTKYVDNLQQTFVACFVEPIRAAVYYFAGLHTRRSSWTLAHRHNAQDSPSSLTRTPELDTIVFPAVLLAQATAAETMLIKLESIPVYDSDRICAALIDIYATASDPTALDNLLRPWLTQVRTCVWTALTATSPTMTEIGAEVALMCAKRRRRSEVSV